MSEIDDGGPAFPIETRGAHEHEVGHGFSGFTHWSMGMSLRDWFAGQALIVLCSRENPCDAVAAEHAYRVADAMLIARNIK